VAKISDELGKRTTAVRIREMKPIVVSVDCLTTGTDTTEIDYIYDFLRPWLRVDTGAIHGVWNGGFEFVFLNWLECFQFFHPKDRVPRFCPRLRLQNLHLTIGFTTHRIDIGNNYSTYWCPLVPIQAVHDQSTRSLD
jgi:hypothetical protein